MSYPPSEYISQKNISFSYDPVYRRDKKKPVHIYIYVWAVKAQTLSPCGDAAMFAILLFTAFCVIPDTWREQNGKISGRHSWIAFGRAIRIVEKLN